MNTISLINKVKYNKYIYTLYYYIGSFLINLLKLFVITNDKLIVFLSFGGRNFDDSPKAIYDAMLHDQRFSNYQLVWAFIQPEKYNIPRGKIIKIDTIRYYKTLLRARVWITNSSMTRGLNFTGKHTFILNTWHGTPIKKIGSDVDKKTKSFGSKGNKNYTDIMLAQGQYDVDIFSHTFHIDLNKFRIIGLPRNDEIVHENHVKQLLLKKKFEIPLNKKVILYAPTFREYDKDKGNNCILIPPINLQKWEENLSDYYVLLFRAHYEVTKMMDFKDNGFVKNVSSYPNLNELMIISDILISDYSSIFFDYSILGKPMLCFAYDFERYYQERGLYFDIRKELESEELDHEDNVISELLQMDSEKRRNIALRFQKKYVEEYGDASKKSLDIIKQQL